MGKEKELVKNTAIITFGKICTQLVSFFLLPLYTTVLSTAEYGVVDLVITYSTLLLPFVTLALEQALFRFLIDVRADKKRGKQYISTTVFTSLFFAFIVFVVLFFSYCITKNELFIYFGLVLVGSAISAISLQISRGLGDNVGYTLGSTVSAILQILCNVLFLVIFKLGAPGMMLASFIGSISCGVVLYIRCNLKSYIHLSCINKNAFKELIKYSMPLIPNQLSWWALNASDKVIVQFFIGIAGNGLIAVANKFSGVYIQFSNIFNVSWTESVALHINDDDAEQYITNTINLVFRLFLCACCGIIVCMPFVFPVMIHQQYSDAYGLIPIFMLASLFNVVVSLYGVIYVAYKKTVEIAKTAIYAATLNIVSHLVLIRFVGIYAAALSTMIGYGGMAIYRYFHSRKYIVIKFSFQTIMLSLLMLAISFLSYYSGNTVFQLVALTTIVAMSFILNKEMINIVLRAVKKKLG